MISFLLYGSPTRRQCLQTENNTKLMFLSVVYSHFFAAMPLHHATACDFDQKWERLLAIPAWHHHCICAVVATTTPSSEMIACDSHFLRSVDGCHTRFWVFRCCLHRKRNYSRCSARFLWKEYGFGARVCFFLSRCCCVAIYTSGETTWFCIYNIHCMCGATETSTGESRRMLESSCYLYMRERHRKCWIATRKSEPNRPESKARSGRAGKKRTINRKICVHEHEYVHVNTWAICWGKDNGVLVICSAQHGKAWHSQSDGAVWCGSFLLILRFCSSIV